MEKMTIAKLVASAAILGLSVWAASGLVDGRDVTYQIPGPYTAEATNDFSTVRVDMTVKGDTITDCVIASSGDNDLMTDAIRQEWADAIVEAQSADTDVITGASLKFSAASVKTCVDDIMVQAGLKDASEIEKPEPAEEPAEVDQPADEPAIDEPADAIDPVTGTQVVEGSSEGAEKYMRVRPAFAETDSAEQTEVVGAEKYMRPRPVFAETDSEDEAVTEAATGDADKYMRPRPAFSETGAADKDEVVGAEKYMRPRPVFAETDSEDEAVTEAATGDADKYMRARPTFSETAPEDEAVTEAASGDAGKYMRPRPTFAETDSEDEAVTEAATGDADKYMRPRPAFAETASEDEAVTEAPSGDASKYMRPRPAGM